MPDTYGPFTGATMGEAAWFRDRGHFEPSGVPGPPAAVGAGELGLTANGLTLSLGLGRAHVRGAYYERTGTAWTYAVPANTNPTLARIDRVVLRRDLAARTVTPAVLQGTPAATPTPPVLTQVENGVWEEPLHRVTVPAASGTVLTLTDDRRWIMPNPAAPKARAKVLATATAAPPVAADGKVLSFNVAAQYDTNGMWNGTSKQFTIPWRGEWRVFSQMFWDPSAANMNAISRLVKGQPTGPPTNVLATALNSSVSASELPVFADWQGPLAAGDVVTLGYYITAAAGILATHWGAPGYFAVEYVGPDPTITG